MQYMLLVYDDPDARGTNVSEDEMHGALRGVRARSPATRRPSTSAQLQPTETAKTVRVKDGETLVTDGPFAETKETLGGYYLVDADSIDDGAGARGEDPVRSRSAARSRCARSWRCSDAVPAAHLRRRERVGSRARRDQERDRTRSTARLSADLARAGQAPRRRASCSRSRRATTVQVRDGDTLVSDGPFAETKEALGGFFLIEAESLDEAIEWAARIPTARYGTIEVRPVVDHSGNGA